jgi:drug/metabolite transporter (DMT)-like permease
MLFGAISEGAPGTLQLVGFTLAIAGVWIISKPEADSSTGLTWKDLQPAVLAGVGFGAFFILTGQFSSSDVSWPLVIARIGTIIVVILIALQTRSKPSIQTWRLAVVAGIMDSVGNFCFALATQTGRLDVGAALSSLYPVTTVLLAVLVLRERVTKTQGVGAALALVSIPLIAL